jgi:hypothetical protein
MTSTPHGAAPQGGRGALDRSAEEAGFYHEAALGATWTGSRLAMGGLTFLFGSFVFAFSTCARSTPPACGTARSITGRTWPWARSSSASS